jgi:hypothetical protein
MPDVIERVTEFLRGQQGSPTSDGRRRRERRTGEA